MDDTPFKLGKIVSNLQALEFLLRMILKNVNKEVTSTKYYDLKVNDKVTEDSFTNYDTLGQLIRKYNFLISAIDETFCISDEVVSLRDVIAHGRVFSMNPNPLHPSLLLKFGKAVDGKVKVSYSEEMNQNWYEKNNDLTYKQLELALNGAKALGLEVSVP